MSLCSNPMGRNLLQCFSWSQQLSFLVTNWSINIVSTCSLKASLRKPDLVEVAFHMFLSLQGPAAPGRITDPKTLMASEDIEHGLRLVEFSQCITGPADHSLWCSSAWRAAWCPWKGWTSPRGWRGINARLFLSLWLC